MSKHTPGPWQLRTMSYGYDLAVMGTGGGGYGGWFIELHSGARENDTQEFRAEFEANARLIAAAPDLLAALKTARFVLNGDDLPDAIMAVEQIDAAIAKVEGRQQ